MTSYGIIGNKTATREVAKWDESLDIKKETHVNNFPPFESRKDLLSLGHRARPLSSASGWTDRALEEWGEEEIKLKRTGQRDQSVWFVDTDTQEMRDGLWRYNLNKTETDFV